MRLELVEVARIAADFAPEPRRRLDAFGFAGDLHLGDDEPFVVAMEDIDVPGPAAKGFAISGLLDQRTFAQQIEHGRRIGTGMAYSNSSRVTPRIRPLMVR